MTDLQEKEERLGEILRSHGRVAIAFSGGADSSLLAGKALEVLGPDNVALLTARSCLLKQGDLANAADWLVRHGYGERGRHHFIELDPLSWPEFVLNPPDRCYACKLRVFTAFLEYAESLGFNHLIDGTNFEDLHTDRPGLRALRELNIGSPLAEAGLRKEEVRSLGRSLGIDTCDRPSASCLATRIPDGLPIAEQYLERIDEIELYLEAFGLNGCRARLDAKNKEKIFLQVLEEDLARVIDPVFRAELFEFLSNFDIKEVLLDLHGR